MPLPTLLDHQLINFLSCLFFWIVNLPKSSKPYILKVFHRLPFVWKVIHDFISQNHFSLFWISEKCLNSNCSLFWWSSENLHSVAAFSCFRHAKTIVSSQNWWKHVSKVIQNCKEIIKLVCNWILQAGNEMFED